MTIAELVAILIISFILSAVVLAIVNMQIEKFLDEIGQSKYYKKKKILGSEYQTEETKILSKYINKILIYVTILFIIILLYINNKYNIMNF